MKTPEFYRIETITDSHVGTGESGFGFIDNLIQRDSATGYPCFNSSGMKGAIKQHIDAYSTIDDKDKMDLMKKVFGSDATVNRGGKQQETQQGESIFFTAHLFALPVRTNKVSYMLTTSPELLRFYEHLRKMVNKPVSSSFYDDIKGLVNNVTPEKGICFSNTYSQIELDVVGTYLEFVKNNELLSELKTLFGTESDRICIVNDITMAELCSDMYLPVIPRNALDDGESKNLWYEQILPRFSVLYFTNIWQDDNQKNFVENELVSKANVIKNPLQVGGNATVSYGFTYITKID